MDIIQDVLIYQTQMMRNSSLEPYVPAEFSPPDYIVQVNALFYASLGVMILAAFIAMLIKSWVREFDSGLTAISIPEQRAKTREFRYLGMERWKLQEMVAMLPLLIQISLLLFAIGLVIFLFHISKPSFGVTTAIFGVGVLYYAVTTTISVFVTSSPFHSPLSRALGSVYRYMHGYFCPVLDEFLSPNMDITPVTAFGRLRRRIQIFLQKSRPYLERTFVEPMTAMTADDVQLSTAASALQRIHDSVPNSQHSELIHQSVWQVAGSPALRMRPLLKLPSWILERGNDKEYFSRLSPANVVAFAAVFVRMRDARYKKRIIGMADAREAVADSRGAWAQVVPAIIGLLPDNFIDQDSLHDPFLHDAHTRRALRFDALLRDALGDDPYIDTLRNDILRANLHSTLPLWHDYHIGRIWGFIYRTLYLYVNYPSFETLRSAFRSAFRDAVHDTPLRVARAFLRDALGNAPLDDMTRQGRAMRVYVEPREPGDLLNILRANKLQEEEAMWLLSTLSGLHCDGLILMKHHVNRICLEILLHQALKWNRITPPSIMLLEAMVTLSAISCSTSEIYQMKTLANSYQHPWLLLNLRNLELIKGLIDKIDDSWREELISLLFLVIHAFILRSSKILAEQYTAIITAKADFASCASALTAIAPVLGDDGFRDLGELLLASQTQFITPTVGGSMSNNVSNVAQRRHSHQDLFDNYDLHLEASELPDPRIAAILLLLSKDLCYDTKSRLGKSVRRLRNDWVQVVANVIAITIPPASDRSRISTWSFYDHRVRNMLAALYLLRVHHKDANYWISDEIHFLPSFLESSEPTICCAALYHSTKSALPPPSYDFSGAIHVVFNPKLPNHYLYKGWDTLKWFVSRFEQLSVEWRQTFARAFFTPSRRALMRGNGQNSTLEELREIISWEYFCKEEHGPELTDAEFSGLDWMATAWSLHLSQAPSVKNNWVNEEFILQVLCRLLDTAPYYSIAPIVPKLREFVAQFDNPTLSEYQSLISVSMEGVFYGHQECKMLYKFQKLHCMWHI